VLLYIIQSLIQRVLNPTGHRVWEGQCGRGGVGGSFNSKTALANYVLGTAVR
jgi:hypothetical protein